MNNLPEIFNNSFIYTYEFSLGPLSVTGLNKKEVFDNLGEINEDAGCNVHDETNQATGSGILQEVADFYHSIEAAEVARPDTLIEADEAASSDTLEKADEAADSDTLEEAAGSDNPEEPDGGEKRISNIYERTATAEDSFIA